MVCAKWFRMRQVFPAISELGSGDPAVEVLDAFFILGDGGRCLALRYVLPLYCIWRVLEQKMECNLIQYTILRAAAVAVAAAVFKQCVDTRHVQMDNRHVDM